MSAETEAAELDAWGESPVADALLAVEAEERAAAEAARALGEISIADLPHGLHLGVPEAVYHQHVERLINVSSLRAIGRSLAHYRAELAAPRKASAAMEIGTAVHMAALEPERFATRYAELPDFGDLRFKTNKQRRDEWRRANAGRIGLAPADWERVRAAARAVQRHPEIGPLVREAQAEVTLRWRDATGLECKGRADALVERPDLRLVLDLKTTSDASAWAFGRSVADYRYHVQQAFYAAGFAAIGRPIDAFLFVAVEVEPPYAVAVYQLSERAEARGRELVRAELALLADAYARNEWPSYPSQITELELPAWA